MTASGRQDVNHRQLLVCVYDQSMVSDSRSDEREKEYMAGLM